VEDHAAAIIVVAHRRRGLQQTDRRRLLVEIDLGIALVGGDDEVMFLGQGDQPRQPRLVDDRTGGVAR
jgi:hypothetical protein